MRDVFKKHASKYALCMVWKCYENRATSKLIGRRSGRKALRQADERSFQDEILEYEYGMMEDMNNTVLLEIRAAEGGEDAKLLVEDMLGAYASRAVRRGL